jgi:hypothetical protein
MACDMHQGRGMPSWIPCSRGWAAGGCLCRRGGHLSAGNEGNALLVGVYVDDLVIIGAKDAEVAAFKEETKATFQMSDLWHLSYLGIEVHQGDSEITLRQTNYTKRIVELIRLTNCNPTLTSMER